MADHQIGERLSINQHNALRDPRDKAIALLGKRMSRQDACSPDGPEAAYEIAHFGQGDSLVGIEPLGLDIDDVEAEARPP